MKECLLVRWSSLYKKLFSVILQTEECSVALYVFDGMHQLGVHCCYILNQMAVMNQNYEGDVQTLDALHLGIWLFTTSFTRTLEFIASLNVEKECPEIPTKIGFYCHKVYIELTRDQLNAVFVATSNSKNLLMKRYANYDDVEFWVSITEGGRGEPLEYDPQSAKASSIRNPILRYVERILSNTLFGRTESGSDSINELYALWCCVHGKKFDVAAYFMLHLDDIIARGHAKLRIGGMVSLIANHFGAPLTRPVPGEDISFAHLTKALIVIKRRGHVFYKSGDGVLFKMPNRDLVALRRNPNNLAMKGAAHKQACLETFIEFIDNGLGAIDPVTGEWTNEVARRQAEQEEEEREYEEGGEDMEIGEGSGVNHDDDEAWPAWGDGSLPQYGQEPPQPQYGTWNVSYEEWQGYVNRQAEIQKEQEYH